MVNVKEEARRLLDRLPDDLTWDDLMHGIYVRKAIESGLSDIETGRTAPVEDVRARFGLEREGNTVSETSGPDHPTVTLTARNRIFCALLSLILGAAGASAVITGDNGGAWIGVPAVTVSVLAAIASLRGGTARWYRAFV